MSIQLPITSSVPQGHVFEPLLLNVYVNDLLQSLPDGSCIAYANDVMLVASAKTLDDETLRLQKLLYHISTWAKLNQKFFTRSRESCKQWSDSVIEKRLVTSLLAKRSDTTTRLRKALSGTRLSNQLRRMQDWYHPKLLHASIWRLYWKDHLCSCLVSLTDSHCTIDADD